MSVVWISDFSNKENSLWQNVLWRADIVSYLCFVIKTSFSLCSFFFFFLVLFHSQMLKHFLCWIKYKAASMFSHNGDKWQLLSQHNWMEVITATVTGLAQITAYRIAPLLIKKYGYQNEGLFSFFICPIWLKDFVF